MTTVPLGQGAYKRLYAGAPEVKLLNRWLESNPANPREGTSVLSRPGTSVISTLDPGTWNPAVNGPPMKGNFSLNGLFSDSLFIACGQKLYKMAQGGSTVSIPGLTFQGGSKPEIAWQKGAGYERLWITDIGNLYHYDGAIAATGTLTKVGAIVNGTDKIRIGPTPGSTICYVWGTTFSGSDAGTTTNPYIVNPLSDPMGQLVKAINGTGVAGTDYSSTLVANSRVSAVETDSTHVALTALVAGSTGNLIATVILGGSGLSFSSTTLTGGDDVGTLTNTPLPASRTPINAGYLTEIAGYVLVSIANTNTFYWINPGDTTFDPLNFATKESSPDPIIAMKTVGDQVLIMGTKSTENWYATGDFNEPFAPIPGRVYARGVWQNTPVVIDDSVFVVGDDGRVYSIGYQAGDPTIAGWGVSRISNNGIEERIRTQMRREEGLSSTTVARTSAWSFVMDGHKFYVLPLGDEGDWAYDTITHEWSQLQTQSFTGINFINGVMWDIRVMGGDLSNAILLELDPTQALDSGTTPVQHIVSGGIPTRTRNSISVANFTLTASVGDDATTLQPISLAFSDDNGVTYSPEFTIPLTNVSTQTLIWNALGSFSAPGRIFRITDYGGPVRIDGADCVLIDGTGRDVEQEGARRR